MHKHEYATLLVVLAVGLAWPCGLQAQRVPSPYRFIEPKQDLGLSFSYIWANAGKAGIGPKAGPAVGLRYTRRISRPLSLTPEVFFFRSERDVIDPSLEEGQEDQGNGSAFIGTQGLDILLVAGRFNLNLTGTRTWHSLAPYLFSGLGIAMEIGGASTCPESPAPDCQIELRERFDFGTSLLLQLGLGTVWIPRQRLSLRIEGLNRIWRIKTPPGYVDPGVTIFPIPQATDWTNNWELALTLSYWF
ncbi:MAG: hypothetical protein GTO46_13960 [Gemmatimonadetes bacterium]|nr:hypothetical protein [Gemmatimonadota bacterium]NIO32694.1 hypothetical protein [Gemmatimonadota bacterium]